MCKIIAIYNAKGGSGKTTSAVNISAAIRNKGNKVLVVDLDGQANATMSLGVTVAPDSPTVYDFLVEQKPLMYYLGSSGVHVVPSDTRMYQLEQKMSNLPNRGWVLQKLLEPLRSYYDFIIIDCPPAFGLASISALIACDYVVLTSNMSGLTKQTTDGIKEIIEATFSTNGRSKILGLLWTMNRYTLENKMVADAVNTAYPSLAFSQVIRMSTYISGAASSGKDIFMYMPNCPVAQDYIFATEEILNRIQNIENYGK